MIKLILGLFFLLHSNVHAQDVDAIRLLSERNKQDVNDVLRILMDDDQFIYTLLEGKPVSLSGGCFLPPYNTGLSSGLSSLNFWRKWSVWKEIQEKFSINRFLFIQEPAYNYSATGMVFIFFIHKNSFLEVVNKNIEAFRAVLGLNVTGIQLLNRMEKEHAFMTLLNGNEILLGILLGYGEHNARLYARRLQLRNLITGSSSLMTCINKILNSRCFSLIEEEEASLTQQLQAFAPCDCELGMISPVQFAADLNHKETQLLKIKYSALRNRALLIHGDKNKYLEFIISELTRE